MAADSARRAPAERPESFRCGPYRLGLERPLIMGILNVTPDSFSDGGLFTGTEAAVARAKKMAREGAAIIDVGGESSRPGAPPVPEEEELSRVAPVVRRLLNEVEIPVSVDTCKALVAGECLALGAHMINDITGLRDPAMREAIASHGAAAVIMHMRGEPATMQDAPSYGDVVGEIKDFFRERIAEARRAGITELVIDPGIGFGKSAAHNLEIISRLDEFEDLGCPLMLGPSRKSFIGAITGSPVGNRLHETVAVVSIAVLKGARLLRVHNVDACRRAALMAEAVRGA